MPSVVGWRRNFGDASSVLHDDRAAIVRIREHQGLAMVDMRQTAEGLDLMDILATDGTRLTRFDGVVLCSREPISATTVEHPAAA